jgi:hypothetical protein
MEEKPMAKAMKTERKMWSKHYSYDEWMEDQGMPIHRGYYIEDLRTLELGWWEERRCNAAFIQLVGQEGVTSARVSEIGPGQTLPLLKFALDEIVYVIPEGFRVEALPAAVFSEFEYGYYKTEYEVDEIDNKLIYRRTLMMKPGVLSAGEYENFRAFMINNTVQDSMQAVIGPVN